MSQESLNEKLEKAQALIKECQEMADAEGLEFTVKVGDVEVPYATWVDSGGWEPSMLCP